MAKKFDIIVRDSDLDRGMHIHKESGVMANSAEELRRLYAMSEQTIQIEREYEDDESRNYGRSANVTHITDIPEVKSNISTKTYPVAQVINPNNQVFVEKKEPPKFFEIGGIKCKMENGKMYQKQWMRLSDTEASEFRIVSDKNNKICPIKDKHIEVMKWVLIQDNTQENPSTEDNKKSLELING